MPRNGARRAGRQVPVAGKPVLDYHEIFVSREGQPTPWPGMFRAAIPGGWLVWASYSDGSGLERFANQFVGTA